MISGKFNIKSLKEMNYMLNENQKTVLGRDQIASFNDFSMSGTENPTNLQ